MAALSAALTFARAQAQTNSDGLSDTNGIVWANEALVDFRRRLIAAGVDASQLQESYQSGTVGTGTYLYPTDMFWLKTIELNYSNNSAGDFVVANQVDTANIPGGKSFGWLRTNANSSSPWFDDRGDWFEIFPTPTSSHNVTDMMRIIYFLEPTEYTLTTDTIAYPESLDYRILGWRIASSHLFSLGKENLEQAVAFENKYQERVTQLIATLSRGSQQPIQATPLQISGWEF